MKLVYLGNQIKKIQQTIIELSIKTGGRRYEKRLLQAVSDPERSQAQLLKKILAKQAQTSFGQTHGFQSIQNVEDFRKALSIKSYEDLRPWIERQEELGERALNSQKPILYAMTSGTTGKPKFVPIHQSALNDYNEIQRFFFHKLLERAPQVLSGHVLAIVGSAVEGHMPQTGTPYGSTSGHMYAGAPALLRSKYLIPASVFSIEDSDLKYLTILRLALGCEDLSYISTANPSTVSRMLHLAHQHRASLVEDIAKGSFSLSHRLDPEVAMEVQGRLKADPERAQSLKEAFQNSGGRLRLKDLWPHLSAIGCWTGGSCGIFLDQWKKDLPTSTIVQEIGYLASEFRGTIALDAQNSGIPTLLEHYFEFVERDEWEEGRRHFKGLHELEEGKEYYLFITTDTGLYRYDINDVVRVDGYFHRTPRLVFIQKGKGVTNVTGEKLYESQLISAVKTVEQRLGLSSDFFFGIADESASGYRLLYQPSSDEGNLNNRISQKFVEEIEQELSKINIEYAAKRKSGRLNKLKILVLNNQAYDHYKAFSVNQGQREGQFKIVALQYQKNVTFPFDSYALSP